MLIYFFFIFTSINLLNSISVTLTFFLVGFYLARKIIDQILERITAAVADK